MKTKLLLSILLLPLLATAQTYTFSTLYAFQNNGKDPANPDAALIVDSADNLYGVSSNGGKYDLGTVFKVTKSGKLTVLHSKEVPATARLRRPV